MTCMFVDRLTGCRSALWRILRDGQDGRAVTLSLHALSLLGLDHFMTGEWETLQPGADQAPAHPQRSHQRIRASRLKAQVNTGSRV
jgi:hypothetical protein